MSVFNELWAFVKPLIGIEEGQTIPKFLVKTGMKRVAKLTPNLSKTILYGKNSRSELMNAFVKLLTGNDELGKQFRAYFSEALRYVNLKTNLLIDEKAKIAQELGKQEQYKSDAIDKLSAMQADEAVDELIETAAAELSKKPKAESNIVKTDMPAVGEEEA